MGVLAYRSGAAPGLAVGCGPTLDKSRRRAEAGPLEGRPPLSPLPRSFPQRGPGPCKLKGLLLRASSRELARAAPRSA